MEKTDFYWYGLPAIIIALIILIFAIVSNASAECVCDPEDTDPICVAYYELLEIAKDTEGMKVELTCSGKVDQKKEKK